MLKFIIPVLVAGIVQAGDIGKLKLTGYLENNLAALVTDSGYIYEQSNLRLEGNWDFGKKGGIETHLVLSAAWQPLNPFQNLRSGSAMENILNELVAGFSLSLDSAEQELVASLTEDETMGSVVKYLPYSAYYPRDNLVVDRALLKLFFKRADLYIGRQVIAWGTGYAFNPTDVWNAKNPLDPGAPKVGVRALRLEIPYDAVSGITLVASPGIDLDHTSWGFRLKQNINGFDVSMCGMRIMNADRELMALRPLAMAGLDLAGQLGEVGIWLESAFINPHYTGNEYTAIDSLYVQLDAGLDYTFKNGLYVMGEYYYNGLGQKQWKDYNGQDLLNLMAGDMSGLGQHYIMTGLRKNLADKYDLTAFLLTNLTDLSAMILPGVEYGFTEDISLNLNVQIGAGNKKQTEYGSVYSTVILKVTGYF